MTNPTENITEFSAATDARASSREASGRKSPTPAFVSKQNNIYLLLFTLNDAVKALM